MLICSMSGQRAERESYLAGWVSIAVQARRAVGCLDVAISADLVDPGRAADGVNCRLQRS
jgi:hypothetical protein